MDEKVARKIGKYEILAELRQGGMAVVYKARDPSIGCVVELRTIDSRVVSDPEIFQRFQQEGQAAATLSHPNIQAICQIGEADGRPYVILEHFEAETLQNIINRRTPLPLAAKLKVVEQFCEGLAHAHRHGVLHRAVKPANILVNKEGTAKLTHFLGTPADAPQIKAGTFRGTIPYAPPEQTNEECVDCRSDIWSVACTIYEFIAYQKAFDGPDIPAIIAKILGAEPEPLSRCCTGVPAELERVISKGLKKNIDERYQSMDEMLADLLAISRGLQP